MKRYLESLGYKTLNLAFADYLRSIVDRNYKDLSKEEYRKMMQYFGTDVVRSMEQDFWANIVYHTIDLLSRRVTDEEVQAIIKESNGEVKEEDLHDIELDNKRYDAFIITDARFENELQPKWFNIGYDIHNVKIDRPDTTFRMTEEQREHSSEKMAEDKPNSEYFVTIINDDTLDTFRDMCRQAVDAIIIDKDTRYKKYIEQVQELYNEISKQEDGK